MHQPSYIIKSHPLPATIYQSVGLFGQMISHLHVMLRYRSWYRRFYHIMKWFQVVKPWTFLILQDLHTYTWSQVCKFSQKCIPSNSWHETQTRNAWISHYNDFVIVSVTSPTIYIWNPRVCMAFILLIETSTRTRRSKETRRWTRPMKTVNVSSWLDFNNSTNFRLDGSTFVLNCVWMFKNLQGLLKNHYCVGGG